MIEKINVLSQFLRNKCEEESLSILEELNFKEPKKSYKNLTLIFDSRDLQGKEVSLLTEAIKSADPDLALNNLERIISSISEGDVKSILEEKEGLNLLFHLCGGSQFLANIVFKKPDLLQWLITEKNIFKKKSYKEKIDEVCSSVQSVTDMVSLQKTLRGFKRQEYLRFGMRDLMELASLEEVMEEISDLASATLEAAVDASKAILGKEYGLPIYIDDDGLESEAAFVILGMGKFGGRELNFSSDIDLIFLYSTEKGETSGIISNGGKATGRLSFHQYFIKLGAMVVKAMNDVTADGFVFRVDMDLRPDGKAGELAISVRGAEIYYESWGQTWERSAMLKARPVAGNIELGDFFLKSVSPFMFRKYLDYGAIEEIGAMKKKIDAKIARDDESLRNLKLGTGGIREIEFFIQTLQLINGGKLEELREKNSLNALKKLKKAGLINEKEEKELSDAYSFLRQIEHRLQIFQERQTHTLPADEWQLELLARRAGYRHNALDSFLNDHRRHTENVKKIYSTLFHEAANNLEKEKTPEIIELLEGGCSSDEAIERLSAYGFRDPKSAFDHLSLLWSGPSFVHFTEKNRSLLRRLAPLLFKEIVASPEPDMAISMLEKFISSVGARSSLYSLLAENHHIIKLVVGLFGTSNFLSRILLSHPEILDSIVASNASHVIKDREMIKDELDTVLSPLEYYEDELDALRRFRNLEMLRIGMNDVYGEIEMGDVSLQLTFLAEVILDKAYEIAITHMKERYGEPQTDVEGQKGEADFTVIAMGKLGGEEMSYSSDLDIIFVYSGIGDTSGVYGENENLKVISNHEFFAKVGQRIISILSSPTREGILFKVDTRLRPSGSAGPLVTSLESFIQYHNQKAQTWEKQALTRARTVAGEMKLGKQILSIIDQNLYKKEVTKDTAKEIDRMRKRMEFELAKEKEGLYNVKTGRGGIVDIEFLVQLLMLTHGASKEVIKTPNTLAALSKMKEAHILSDEDFSILSHAYSFLRKIENRLRIVHDKSVSELNTTSDDFALLARRLGTDSQKLLSDYISVTNNVRSIYNRHLNIQE